MKRKEVKYLIFEKLTSFFSENGFKAYKAKEMFKKITPDGFFNVSIIILDYEPEFHVKFVLGIRINEIENIYNQFSFVIDEGKNESETTLTSMDYFTGKEDDAYIVSSEDDLIVSLRNFQKLMLEKGFGYFQQFSSIQALDKEINPVSYTHLRAHETS